MHPSKTLIIFVFILLAIGAYKMLSIKETFITQNADLNPATLSKSHREFSVEPCRILKDNSISDANIPKASALLDADRIKLWKPNNIKKESNKTHCYIDNDPDNKVQDYIMIDKQCDKSDPIFKDATFITKTFEDNLLDRTRTFPLKKCVFEIDNNSINPESLDKFWENVNIIDCYNRTAPLLTKRKEISKELEGCKSDLQNRNDMAIKTREQLLEQDAYILKLQEIEDTLQKDIQSKQKNIQDAKLNIDANVNIYKEIEHNTNKCQQEFKDQNLWWQNTFDDLNNVYTNVLDSTNVLQEQYDTLLSDTCFSQITQQKAQLDTTYKDYTELNTNYKITANRYQQVYDDLQKNKESLEQCNIPLNVCNSNLPNKYSILDKVTQENNTCQTSLSICTTSLSACRSDVASLTKHFDTCSVNLTDCIKNKSALQTLTEQQKKEIDYLRSLIKSCDNVNVDHNQYNLSLNAIQKLANDREAELQGARNALADVQWNFSKNIIDALKSDMPNICPNTPQVIANKALQDQINNPKATTTSGVQSLLPPPGTSPFIFVLADVRASLNDDQPLATINNVSTADCQDLCAKNNQCSLFVFDKGNGGTCYLKGNTPDNPTNDDNMFCVPKTTHVTGIKTNLFSKVN